MHELGLARTIAATILSNGWGDSPVEIRVRGGHSEPAEFDAALLAHLACEAPAIATGRVTIVHLPTALMCSVCTTSYSALPEAPCTRCGGPPLPSLEPEQIELSVEEPEAVR